MRAALIVLAVIAGAMASAGCSVTRTDATDGGLLTRSPDKNQSEMTAIVGGTLELDVDRGCFLLSGRPVIWPTETTLATDPLELRLPGGKTARPGDSVTGGGGYVPASAIRQTSLEIEGDLTKALACAPADSEVVVFWARGGGIRISAAG